MKCVVGSFGDKKKAWIVAVPDMTAPFNTTGKLEHLAWFSPEE
jgi:hypothetical protein